MVDVQNFTLFFVEIINCKEVKKIKGLYIWETRKSFECVIIITSRVIRSKKKEEWKEYHPDNVFDVTSAARFPWLTFWHQVSLFVSAPLRDGKFRNNNGTTAIPSSSRRGCNYEHVSAVIAEWCPAATRPQRAARRAPSDAWRSWWRNNWILSVSRVEFRPVDVVLRGCARRGIALEPFRLPNIAQPPLLWNEPPSENYIPSSV